MKNNSGKPNYKMLFLSILLDLVGMVSYLIPGVGEFFDVVWAPVSAYLLTRFYKGNVGKVAGVIGFVEEAMPGLDIIPTFTLTWIYTQFFASDNATKLPKK